MGRIKYLVSMLRTGQIGWIPVVLVSSIVVYVAIAVRTLASENDETHQYLIISAMFMGAVIVAFIAVSALNTLKRKLQLDKQEAEIKALFSRYVNSRDLLHQ
ncbi:hypothetical protein EBT25_13305, partial [bacterium]|nr:hypothetical protein [bacterium]